MNTLKTKEEYIDKINKLKVEKRRLERRVEELSLLQELSQVLNNNYSHKELLVSILDMALKTTNSEVGIFFLTEDLGYDLKRVFIKGDVKGQVIDYLKQKSELITKIQNNPQFEEFKVKDDLINQLQQFDHRIRSLIAVPVQISGRLFGIIVAMHLHADHDQHQISYSQADRRILTILAQKVGLVVENTYLKLEEQRQELYLSTITALTNAIDAKDVYTAGHSNRVARLAVNIALDLGLTQREVKQLRYGAILHDIGKIGVPELILNKKGRLNEQEYNMIKRHPQIGFNILKSIDFLGAALDVIKYHHERVDGNGYPSGLVGQDIPLLARITCIADAWDAMTTDRSYRPALSLEKALKELRENAGTQFDSEIITHLKNSSFEALVQREV